MDKGDHLLHGMDGYFACLHGLIQGMTSKELGDELTLTSAWVLLIFRAMCWHRCHALISGKLIPTQFCGSQLPVYIG